MSLRRPRSHKVGISNIDFRTKKDTENLNIFDPWIAPKDLGTMGLRNYKNPQSVYQKLFGPSEKINTHKDLVNDYPDPRFHTTAQFYKKNNILVNTKSFINSQRVANLEETFKGKDVFNGDSINAAEINRIRKGKQFDNKKLLIRNSLKEPLSYEDHKIQEDKIEKLVKEKKKLNRNSTQETQLVKINPFIDKGDSIINLKKIEEVRIALRRRYANRKKLNKIFQQWAKTFPNKITAYDAYKMINALSIPINYNETKAFIASGSNTGSEFLTIEEFYNLIYEPTKMPIDDKKYLYEEKEEKKICEKIILNNKSQIGEKNLSKLENFISQRLIRLNKKIKELNKEKFSFANIVGKNNYINLNLVDYDKFKNGILSLKPPDNFGKEEYIKKIFDEYKNKDNLIDIRIFSENILEKNSKDFLTIMKDKTLEISKEQYENTKNKFQNYINENIDEVKPLIFQKKIDLDSQISLKQKIIENEKNDKKIKTINAFSKQVNSTIPSLKWLHHVYDNNKEHFKKLNQAEENLSAPIIKKIIPKPNTRFGSVPTWRNTADIFTGDEKCSTFINEKDRFNVDRDVNKEDKRKKNLYRIKRENRIRTAKQKYENNNYFKMLLKEENDIYSNMKKSKRLTIYNENNKSKNLIFE